MQREPAPDVSTPSTSPSQDAPPADRTIGRLWRDLGPLGPLALAASTLPLVGVITLIYFRTPIAEWFRAQGGAGFGLFIVMFGVATGFALSPTHVPAAIAGYVFGFPHGAWAAMGGVMLGAVLGYLIARGTAGDRMQQAVAKHEKAQLVYDALVNSGAGRRIGLVFLLRLTTSPFALTNVVLAAARIGFPTYFFCTLLGIAPRTIAAAWIGSALRDLGGEHPAERWIKIGGIALSVITVLVVGQIGQRALQRTAAAEEARRRRA